MYICAWETMGACQGSHERLDERRLKLSTYECCCATWRRSCRSPNKLVCSFSPTRPQRGYRRSGCLTAHSERPGTLKRPHASSVVASIDVPKMSSPKSASCDVTCAARATFRKVQTKRQPCEKNMYARHQDGGRAGGCEPPHRLA